MEEQHDDDDVEGGSGVAGNAGALPMVLAPPRVTATRFRVWRLGLDFRGASSWSFFFIHSLLAHGATGGGAAGAEDC